MTDRFNLLKRQRRSCPLIVTSFITCSPLLAAVFMLGLVVVTPEVETPNYAAMLAMIAFGFTIGLWLAVAQCSAVFYNCIKSTWAIVKFYLFSAALLFLGFVVQSSGVEEKLPALTIAIGLALVFILLIMAFAMMRHARVLEVVQRMQK